MIQVRACLLFLLSGYATRASAQDLFSAATAAQALGGAGAAIGIVDTILSGVHCIELAASDGAAPPPSISTHCAMLPLNAMSAAGMMASMAGSGKAAAATEAQDKSKSEKAKKGDKSPFENKNAPSGVSPEAWALCQDQGATPTCLGALQDDLNSVMSAYKDGLVSGAIPSPDGLSPEEAIAQLDAALDGQALDGEFEQGKENMVANRAAVNAGMDFDGGGSMDAVGGDKKTGGPTSPIKGKLVIKNDLERLDSETGLPLTLWQLATLRYLGPSNSRYMGLARIEYLRQRTQKIATRAALPTGIRRGPASAHAAPSPITPTKLPMN